MSLPDLEIRADPGVVWHVGFAPDLWAWTPWVYATDAGLFDGRWDDQLGQFRTLYMADTLLGCFLELLARFRADTVVEEALDDVDDDDGTIGAFPEVPTGTVGFDWLDSRMFGRGQQSGRYCFITHSRSVAALQASYRFDRHGIAPINVDAALLKNAQDRVLTRSVARWLFDLRDEHRNELVDGVEFRSRHGDEIRMWAVFERAEDDSTHSEHIRPGDTHPVTPETPELLEALDRYGLRWAES